MQPIYLDNAASTRVSDEVVALMTEVMRTAWGNASAAHPQGAAARGHIETARTRMLAALGDRGKDGDLGTIVWTSGCSDANALAVLGAARTHAGGIAFRQRVPEQRRSPHILARGIAGVPAGALRNVLASRGVYISTGSACSSEGVKASPTLAAIGLPEDHGMVRLSFALDTTADEVTRAAEILADVASSLRKAPRQ